MKPVCVSTWSDVNYKYFQTFITTARNHGIEPQNADHNSWGGTDWKTIEWFRKCQAQAGFIRNNLGNFTHFMFTDAYDIAFAAGWDEIMRKFLAYESPIVFGSECFPWPYPDKKEQFPKTHLRCRFLNAGFWMAEAKAALEFIDAMEPIASKREQCDQGIAVDLFLSGKFPIILDSKCALLHCCNLDSMDYLEFRNGRITNTETGETPSIFHGNGGSPLHQLLQWL